MEITMKKLVIVILLPIQTTFNSKLMTKKLILLFLNFPLFIFSQGIEITHGPYLQQMGENEATIIWTTNNDALSWVELAPIGNDSFYAFERPKYYETAYGSKKIGKLHRINLSGLQPGTEYRYRIFSKEIVSYENHRVLYGNIASSNVYSQKPYQFRTLDVNAAKVSFRVVNDLHSKNENLRKMLGDTNRDNTDLVIFNGDMVSMLNDTEQIFTGFMDTAVALFAKEIPLFFSRGNHESRGRGSAGLYDYFPTKTGEFYYSFQAGPVFFIILDGGEDKPDSDIEYSELAHFDAYRSNQAEWLEFVVSSAAFQQASYRIVIMHIPPTATTWHGTKDVVRKFTPILNNADIDVMLCGHTHNYTFIEKGEDPAINFPILINDDENWLDIIVDSEIRITQKDMYGSILKNNFFRHNN